MPPARSNAARPAPQSSAARRSAQRAGGQPPARAAATASTATPFQPRKVKSRAPLSRIRWDRAARAGLIAVLALIGYLWISGIVSLVHSHAQAEAGLAQVRRLTVIHQQLQAKEKALHQKSTILDQARGLGMVKQGEQSFILTP
jgi:cell division protein FtsB